MVYDQYWETLEEIGARSRSLGIPSIDPEDGLILYSIAVSVAGRASGSVEALDLGAGIGYSTLWIAAGLEDACPQTASCRVTAVEANARLASAGEEATARAGLRRVRIRWVAGDAIAFLEGIPNRSVDLAFVDIEKYEYPKALELLEYKLKPGGVALFHNAYFPRPPESFFHAVSRGPWRSGIAPTPQGLLIAVLEAGKRRGGTSYGAGWGPGEG
ncbi:MAG: class I SAM-dependent methyltransferase [Desulfurococcales archaeon]|nr:class I SAM-dependent methyltransferase [Desulfurococcales archaeon]